MQLLEEFDTSVLSEEPPQRNELLKAAQGATGVLSVLTEKMDAEFMDAAGDNLKVIANFAVGYDNVDVAAAKERGIVVTNTPEVLNETTADTTFMLMLAAARRMGEAERFLRAGKYTAWGPKLLMGPDVWGKKLGILGMGRIGQAVARRALGFGMEIYYYDQARSQDAENELGAQYLEFNELLESSDFVSLHTPLTPDTRHLISTAELNRMKPEAVLVNASRGPVVDEEALANALQNGDIFAAGLDVFEEEPKVNPKLFELDNAVLLPHIGSASVETRDKMAMTAAENLRAVLHGKQPSNPVW